MEPAKPFIGAGIVRHQKFILSSIVEFSPEIDEVQLEELAAFGHEVHDLCVDIIRRRNG